LFGGFGVDQFVCIPFTNFHKNYPDIREILFAVSIRDDYDLSVARNDLEQVMRRRRHLRQNSENDFEIIDPSFLSNLWDQLTGALILLTGVISSIGLLVGGIGVMNVMLISVTERTAEIGLRKATGARKFHIRAQFLFEAVMLSFSGGVIGILCGAVIAYTVRALVPSVPAGLSIFWVSMGVAISVGVGLFFGYYPATRAANLDPSSACDTNEKYPTQLGANTTARAVPHLERRGGGEGRDRGAVSERRRDGMGRGISHGRGVLFAGDSRIHLGCAGADGSSDDPWSALETFEGENFAKAGLAGAIVDQDLRARGVPLWQWLGSTGRPVPSGVAIGLYDTVEELLQRVARFTSEGYQRIKIKIQPGWDVEPVSRIRAEYPTLPLMVDANAAYKLRDLPVFRSWTASGS